MWFSPTDIGLLNIGNFAISIFLRDRKCIILLIASTRFFSVDFVAANLWFLIYLLVDVHFSYFQLNDAAILPAEMYFQAGSSTINKDNKDDGSFFNEQDPFKRSTVI